MTDYYRIHHREQGKRKGRIIALIIVIIFIILLIFLGIFIRNQLKPQVSVKQAKAISSKISYDTKTKHYDEGDFGIDLPTTWGPLPRPDGPYKSFTWQSALKGGDAQQIEIYQDVIPVNFAVNRMQVIEAAEDQLRLVETVSDNCSKYTKGVTAAPGQTGVPAKWQGVDFLCDQSNTSRDVIGTSSTDGINTVILKSQNSGLTHKFFFTYTNHSVNPDYTVFADALQSFRMQ